MENWIDSLITVLKSYVTCPVTTAWPDVDATFPQVVISRITGEPVLRQTVIQESKTDTATILKYAINTHSVLFQIDIFATSSRERDRLFSNVVNGVRSIQVATANAPILFRRIPFFESIDEEDAYRFRIDARFWCFEISEATYKLVLDTQAQIIKEV